MLNTVTRSVSRKLTIMIFCILIVFSLCAAYISYVSQRAQHMDTMVTIHETNDLTATLVGSFVAATEDKLKAGGNVKNDTDAGTVVSVLDSMVGQELVENAYLFFPDSVQRDGKTYLKMLASNTKLAEALPSNSDYELNDIFMKAVSGLDKSDVVLTDSYTDSNGTFISTLSRITDANGKVIAIFGLDFTYGEVQKVLRNKVLESVGIALVLGLLFSCLIWYIIVRQLAPFKELTAATQRAAGGDFSFQMVVTRKDEFGRLKHNFNEMLRSVSTLLQEIRSSTQEVVASSHTMRDGSGQSLSAAQSIAGRIQEIAANGETQLQSTEEAKRAIEEMAVAVQRIAQSAGDVTEHVMGVSAETDSNRQLMAQTVAQKESINESVQLAAEKLRLLLERSSDIQGIVDIISEIAGQTNLLSLNASIEAARAGEHGRGFAVVAGEIRKLAEQTRASSEEIAELIRGTNEVTGEIAESMTIGAQKALSGAEIVHQAHEGFDRIAKAMNSITAQVEEVSAATEQLSASSEEMAATMEELARAAEQSSRNAQEIASAVERQVETMDALAASSEDVRQTADRVKDGIGKFVVS
ncbi:methyl-accepting chemotaxis protein [Paenibacillus flagellatus]|uniref:Methyl-accepting chemotaxis protein n=1 Tax=Paenibacillus flagellatus TaxID=2211139 RepID=A0A2V5KG09_9BACL|nr:HAMP domain-containing methyl-accepting chemotaxis protein [Paenibacillus flagellatus]PYI57514.1 hypothetical protein DLM86_03530 [Paenibacillus flagellatus]